MNRTHDGIPDRPRRPRRRRPASASSAEPGAAAGARTDTAPAPGAQEAAWRLVASLTDPVRLRVLGAAAAGGRTLAELTDATGLDADELDAHLAALCEAGWMRAIDSDPPRWSIHLATVHRALKDAAAEGRLPEDLVVAPARERGIRGRYFDGDRILRWPSKYSDRVAILEEVVRMLPERDRIPEREMNELLEVHHEDYCRLRRSLVDLQYMSRSGGVYWFTEKGHETRARSR